MLKRQVFLPAERPLGAAQTLIQKNVNLQLMQILINTLVLIGPDKHSLSVCKEPTEFKATAVILSA